MRPLRSPRSRFEHNIKIDIREIGFEEVDWMHLVQDWDRLRSLANAALYARLTVGLHNKFLL